MEVTVISGKGGTGKTTVAAAIAELEKEKVIVDCDVDAPNFYLYFQGENIEQEDFSGGKKAVVDTEACNKCGLCQKICCFSAIKDGCITSLYCEGCGACSLICPQKAITLHDEKSAEVFITDTSKGKLIRAQMEIGSEGSGKLITVLRKKASGFGEGKITIIDGSPGIGCPVISSITAANLVIIVTEPTQSGKEDLLRIIELCKQFRIPSFVCINKADINNDISEEIERLCQEYNINFAGRIPYDDMVLTSINELSPITNYKNSTANKAIRQIWSNIKSVLALKSGITNIK